MTRINLVPVETLHVKHLVAEYRELPRVFSLARTCPDAPKEYVLGSGHVKFFYDKLGFLANRFGQLVLEMRRRGYNPTIDADAMWHKHPKAGGSVAEHLYGHYEPTPQAIALSAARIKERQPKGAK